MSRPLCLVAVLFLASRLGGLQADELQRLPFNNPGLAVDLGVGLWAWPLPMDYDEDGDLDLVVSCPDAPYNGTYFFENSGHGEGIAVRGEGGQGKSSGDAAAAGRAPPTARLLPRFKPGVRIANGLSNVEVSYVDGQPVVMSPGVIYRDFRSHQYSQPIKLPLPTVIDPQFKRVRANQWKLVDYDGDGRQDLVIGHEFWDDYGWDNAWNEEGVWQNGPLHGFVYWVQNTGTTTEPRYAAPQKMLADGKPLDVFGMPSPNFADFDGDGDLDLLCGEFLDGFTYFENVGSRTEPRYAGRGYLWESDHLTRMLAPQRLHMDLEMITPVVVDWDGDGNVDIVCGDEDGRVALLNNTGQRQQSNGSPIFDVPRYFQQEAAEVKFGALVTPASIDWDGDGDDDLICGNTAGYLGFLENQGGAPVKWQGPVRLETFSPRPPQPVLFQEYHVIRHRAGPNGSIQGPCEAKWGYTAPCAADWNHDGLPDLVVNDIWGKVVWYENLGAQEKSWGRQDQLRPAQPLRVAWSGSTPKPAWTWWTPEPGTLVTQWRTTPCVVDWNHDGLNDLVMLDPEGYLAFYERSPGDAADEAPGASAVEQNNNRIPQPTLVLRPPRRIFKIAGPSEFDGSHKPVGESRDGLLRLNAREAGASGRRKLHVVDWDLDGDLDLLVNSTNATLLLNVRTDEEGFVWFQDEGPLDSRKLAGHDTAPTTVDWDRNGVPDLLVGAEDGHLYYMRHPDADRLAAKSAVQ